MITAGTYPSVNNDLSNDELGISLRFKDAEGGQITWRDYTMDDEAMLSPVDIDKLPAGVYRLVNTAP